MTTATDQQVTEYVAWAHAQGSDPDEVVTLKAYEATPGMSRNHADRIADALYVGGGEPTWRQS
jgi:hypothetical protein